MLAVFVHAGLQLVCVFQCHFGFLRYRCCPLQLRQVSCIQQVSCVLDRRFCSLCHRVEEIEPSRFLYEAASAGHAVWHAQASD